MKVLIADDDKVTRKTLQKNLELWGYDIVEAESGSLAWELLSQSEPPRIAVLDWMMPGYNGVEICKMLRDREEAPFIYTILLTTKNEREDLVFALESGAHNFQSKPISRDELRAHISVGKRLVDADDKIKRYAKEMELLAATDPLTGANNRRHFFEHADQELSRSQRYGHPLSVLMLDIDHFKQINDTHGHAAGDKALRALVVSCLDTLRVNDLFGRMGGDEFAAILPETTLENAMTAAERVRAGLEETPLVCGETEVRLTVSIGVAGYEEDQKFDTIYKRVDDALYEAKKQGRNRTVRK